VLASQGYRVSTATDGIDALNQMEFAIPDVVISDLNMPKMSGFELLPIVRRRFPSVRLFAISGVYDAGGKAPEGVIADAFYAKGRCRPANLLLTVADLMQTQVTCEAGPTRRPALAPEVQA
jgi:CheY-like chemotaxis protein